MTNEVHNIVAYDLVDAAGAVVATHCCYDTDLPSVVPPAGLTVVPRVVADLSHVLQREINYVGARVTDYPSIGDQLDVIWKLLATHPEFLNSEARRMLNKINAVKAAYPKTDTFVMRSGEEGGSSSTYIKKG